MFYKQYHGHYIFLKLSIDYPLPLEKPERVSETQIIGVSFQKEIK